MKIISTIFSAVMALAVFVWLGWVLLATQPCDRVNRAIMPVGLLFDAVTVASENWITNDSKGSLIISKYQAIAYAQKGVQRTLYGDLQCSKF